MSTLRRRLLMMVGNSLPNYSDYRGIYIEDVEGYLYTEDEWNGSKTANGIAVLTDNCRFVIALQDAYTSTCRWGGYGKTVSGIVTTTNSSTAQADYAGYSNTDTIISALNGYYDNYVTGAPAAEYCKAFTFPDGNKGYLGAAGEWKVILDNKASIVSALSKCGGSAMKNYYWTSTQSSSNNSWCIDYDSLTRSNKRNSYYARAFTTLKSDKWSEGSEGDSSTANIYWETQSGVWNRALDPFGYDTYTCESPGDGGSTIIRCYFSGVTSITFRCVSNGEAGYDYLTIGYIDDYCDRDYYKDSLRSRSGMITDVTYSCDTAEHYVEFCYSKDGSYSESTDNATVYVASYSK